MSDKKYIRLPTELFSSIERFVHSSDYFPTSDRRLGLSARIGYHPDYKRIMVEIEEERPSFLSTTRGEYVEVEEANVKLAQTALELAEYCREVAKELLEHAERLREIGKREEIVKSSHLESITQNESKGRRAENSSEESRTQARTQAHTHVHTRAKSNAHARTGHREAELVSDANLDLFI